MSSVPRCAVEATGLFSEVYLLEKRQDEILAGFALSQNQNELQEELGEISAALQKNYSFISDRVWSVHYGRE